MAKREYGTGSLREVGPGGKAQPGSGVWMGKVRMGSKQPSKLFKTGTGPKGERAARIAYGEWRQDTLEGFRPTVPSDNGAEALEASLEGRQIPYNRSARLTSATATVGAVMTMWLESGNWATQTRRAYEQRAEIVRTGRHASGQVSPLGRIRLADLTVGHCDDLYATLSRQGMAPGTVGQVHTVLSQALKYAERRNLVTGNVARLADRPRYARQPVTFPTTEQVLTMIEDGGQFWGTLVAVLAHTGMRVGELCALRWTDIDLDAGRLTIARSIDKQRGKGSVEKSTKTGKVHTIKISASIVERLRSIQATTTNPYVFGWTTGDGPMLTDYVRQKFRNGLAPEGIHPHSLRHFCATQLHDNGATWATVADRLGDTIEVVMSTYAHAVESATDEAADLLPI